MANNQTDVPPPLQDLPTAKEKKYDRQLRLWLILCEGATGQVALEHTHVLLINNTSGVTGVEALKNLVLPGIGHFTILDSAIVSEADLGVNFFLDDASLGKYRAEETCRLLMELNPDVSGHAITEPLESWVAKDKAFTPYTLVLIAAPLNPAVFQTIESHIHTLAIPAFYLHCVGYFSHFSLDLPAAFPVVDTHPDPTAITDLRLMKPWPALIDFAKQKTVNMHELNDEDFAHIPYVCLLLHYLFEWQAMHNGKLPETYKEKTAFRDLVRSGSASEENFDEACAAVLKALNPPVAPSSVREILTAPEAQDLTATSPPFWVITNAVQQFYQKHDQLPLPGAVPDMKAQSDTYIQLQSIYKAKAREDCAEVIATVRELEKQTHRSLELIIPENEIENFCKGAAHVSLVRGRPLKIVQPDTVISFGDRAEYIAAELTNPESLVGIYITFLAWDEYIVTHIAPIQEAGKIGSNVPGGRDDGDVATDIAKLTGIAHKIIDSVITEAGTFIEDPKYSEIKAKVGKICLELVRAGGVELHNIASLTGGLIAQEVIKVITKQYVPIDNTCVFDGIGSKSYVLRV